MKVKAKLKTLYQKLKIKAAELWDKFTSILARILVWCIQNWEILLVLLSALTGLTKHISKVKSAKAEEEYRNRRFYDRRTDRWCYANKHLTRKQQNLIEERYLDGESYRSILDSMGLLK